MGSPYIHIIVCEAMKQHTTSVLRYSCRERTLRGVYLSRREVRVWGQAKAVSDTFELGWRWRRRWDRRKNQKIWGMHGGTNNSFCLLIFIISMKAWYIFRFLVWSNGDCRRVRSGVVGSLRAGLCMKGSLSPLDRFLHNPCSQYSSSSCYKFIPSNLASVRHLTSVFCRSEQSSKAR